ncbi:MAG: cytochrome c3 family protein [Planctomycetota bacterium]|jgi:hypothetical protein
MFTKKFDRRVYATLIVIVAALVLGGSFGTYTLWPANVETGYQPEQPVDFSHYIMAGEFEIECIYCHSQAEKGAYATIPPTSTCMKCHTEIKPKNARGELKPAVVKMLEYWESKEPIPWVKVHDLADFVYFDHSRHTLEEVECEECHGKVETMDRVQRVYSLKMGWCLECHMQDPTERTPEGQETRGPIYCSACHR